MIRLLVVVVGFACSACGGRARPVGGPDVAVDPDHGGPLVVSEALGERDCDALLDHTIALDEAEHPVEPRVTAAERATARAELRPGFIEQCQRLARPVYRCALAAASTDAIKACD